MVEALKIFINYRHTDSQHFAEKLLPWLIMRYGINNVFMDYTSIPEFEKFQDFIKYKVLECDIMVSIIGPTWIDHIQQRQARGQTDFVVMELETAIAANKIIAPICVDGARPPAAEDLPPTLRPILEMHIPSIIDARTLHHIMPNMWSRFEQMVADSGRERIALPDPQTPTRHTTSLDDTLDALLAVYKAGDCVRVLTEIETLYARDIMIYAPFQKRLAEISAACQAALRQQKEAQQRKDKAAFIYKIVRVLQRLDSSPQQIHDQLALVWAIYPDYDPDGIAATLPDDIASDHDVPDPPRLLPRPFAWCYVWAGRTHLHRNNFGDHADHIPKEGLTVFVEPFYLARYCVTNAQFDAFIDHPDGYRDPYWWNFSPEAIQWRAANPSQAPTAHSGDTLPRTNVNWYEAMAFSRWLSDMTGSAITLPTERKWQLGALGTDGRSHPWSNANPTQATARFMGRGIVGPLAVDSLPEGASPCGALHMAGNVWEWCYTGWSEGDQILRGQDQRVLRGGSWANTAAESQLALRERADPATRDERIGFRLMRHLS